MDQTERTGDATPTPITAAPGADCAGQGQVKQHLAAFDQLDFQAWNDRNWDLFRQLHTDNVKVVGFGQATATVRPRLRRPRKRSLPRRRRTERRAPLSRKCGLLSSPTRIA